MSLMEHRFARRLLDFLADIADWLERPRRSPWRWLKDWLNKRLAGPGG